MSEEGPDISDRFGMLVASVKQDRSGETRLFEYIWAMTCVNRGLLRIVSERHSGSEIEIVVEEVRTSKRKIVRKPPALDCEMESLAIRALDRMIAGTEQSK